MWGPADASSGRGYEAVMYEASSPMTVPVGQLISGPAGAGGRRNVQPRYAVERSDTAMRPHSQPPAG